MSIYFHFGDGEQVQVASNMGWRDVRKFVEQQDHEGPLKQLVENGDADSIAGLSDNIREMKPDDESVSTTLAGIVETLDSHDIVDDSVVVTDGMEPDEGVE